MRPTWQEEGAEVEEVKEEEEEEEEGGVWRGCRGRGKEEDEEKEGGEEATTSPMAAGMRFRYFYNIFPKNKD
jgi:hypothetical protein